MEKKKPYQKAIFSPYSYFYFYDDDKSKIDDGLDSSNFLQSQFPGLSKEEIKKKISYFKQLEQENVGLKKNLKEKDQKINILESNLKEINKELNEYSKEMRNVESRNREQNEPANMIKSMIIDLKKKETGLKKFSKSLHEIELGMDQVLKGSNSEITNGKPLEKLKKIVQNYENKLIIAKTESNPDNDNADSKKTDVSNLFLYLRDNEIPSIKETYGSSLDTKEREKLIEIFYDCLMIKIEDFKEEVKDERNISNELFEKLKNATKEKLEIDLKEDDENLKSIIKRSLKLSDELLKIKPKAKIFLPKKGSEFDSKDHELTNKQEISISNALKPGLRFGGRTFVKSTTIVDLE